VPRDIRDICQVRDTLSLARRMHPGQRNSLDALAKRYDVDNSMSELHGALLDARILAEVFLVMTGGQVSLSLDAESAAGAREASTAIEPLDRDGLELVVLAASDDEREAHTAMLAHIRDVAGITPLWDAGAPNSADNPAKSP
jgi:DNA polymerase-3 subunit epsilon